MTIEMRRTLFAMLLLALPAHSGEISDGVRDYIEPQVDAKIVTLTCPETPEETKAAFVCSGGLADGEWLHVKATRVADGPIDINEIVVYPPAATAIRKLLRNGVTADFRTVTCPPDAGVHESHFRCDATLIDGSRLSIRADRETAGVIAFDPLEWDPLSPSPLVKAVRDAAANRAEARIETIACPYELSTTFDCEVHYAGGRTTNVHVNRKNNGFAVESNIEDYLGGARRLAWLAIATAVAFVIGGVWWLISLNVHADVARVPFGPQQLIDLPAAGQYVLHLIVPYLTLQPLFRRPQYELREAATGREVPLYFDLFPTHYSWRKFRRSVRLFSVDHAGKYLLSATAPDRDTSKWELMVTRGFLLRGFLAVLMIVGGTLAALFGILARFA